MNSPQNINQERSTSHEYINTSGHVVVPLKYNHAEDFKGGLAKVGNYDGGKDENGERTGKFGFIDKTGKEIVPLIYNEVEDFDDGLALVKKDGKYGFVDQTGKEIVPLVYDAIGSFSLNKDYKVFKDGLARVRKGEKYGFVDTTGKEVIPPVYDMAGEIFDDRDGFNEGYVCVRKGRKYGYIDKTGKEVVPFIYDDANNFSEGLAWVRKGKKWGILKINEPDSNVSSSNTTSDVPTTNNSTDTSATAINIDDYIGKWHINGQNYDSDYYAYERNLSIINYGEDYLFFQLFYFRLGTITSKLTLNGDIVDFTFNDGTTEIKGTLTFNENSITVNIKSSNFEYMPVETMRFDSREAYDDGSCPRCGREMIYNSCDCTWCDICNAWVGGHGHEEEPVDAA